MTFSTINEIKDSRLNFLISEAKNHQFNLPQDSWRSIEVKKFNLNEADLFVVVGIGGSYMGLKSIVDFLGKDRVIFIGNSLDEEELEKNISKLEGKSFILNVISKSGKTLEVVIAFNRIVEAIKEKNLNCVGKYFTTSNSSSKLYLEAKKEGFELIELNSNIVGRYSTLHIGMPLFSFLNLDLEEIKSGFLEGIKDTSIYRYAALRKYFFEKGFILESFQVYNRKMVVFTEWLKQLFGESEGKDGKGVFPISMYFTQDLHSLGQYLQEGRKIFFQTNILLENSSALNKLAAISTMSAHEYGGLNNLKITIPENNEYNFAYLIGFFQSVCVISSSLFQVNSYDNNGVNEYKARIYKHLKSDIKNSKKLLTYFF